MKIAFIVNVYPPRMGGVEQHLRHLAHGLVELGHAVTVLTIADHPEVRQEGAVTVLTGKAHLPVAEVISFPSLGSRRQLTAYLREHDIDVVSTHTRFFPMSFVGLRAAMAAGIPVVHTEHGSGFVANQSPIIVAGSRTVDLTAGRYVLRHADRVLGISEEAASFAQQLGGVETEVFYNAIPDPQHTGEAHDRPQHLVFVGRMVPGKGWDTYLEAVAKLRELGHQVDGEMLGGGVDLERARERARELKVDDIIRIPGRVSPEQVSESLAGATLVNPTVLSEGFQTTILEALAERGRVVTFAVPGSVLLRDSGMPIRISEEKTSDSLVDALVECFQELPAPASPQMIEPWVWSNRAKQYSDILTDVVNEHRLASSEE